MLREEPVLWCIAGLLLAGFGLDLLIAEAGVRAAREVAREVRIAHEKVTSVAIADAVSTLYGGDGISSEAREEKLHLQQVLFERLYQQHGDSALLHAATKRLNGFVVENLSKKPMPGRIWCHLAALRATTPSLSDEALAALGLCYRAKPGDWASLVARWRLSLMMWETLPDELQSAFVADMDALAHEAGWVANAAALRLASITAREAPRRADLVRRQLAAASEALAHFDNTFANERRASIQPPQR